MVTSLKQLVPQLITRFGLHLNRDNERISTAWKDAVGEPFAAITNVSRLTRGTLEITVPHNAFVQELSFRKNELLNAIQTAVPDIKIKRLKFVAG
ncbi:MAG: DUF721 domain-containing protein [Planctomycetaceae bacterium]|jgi:predicted nucleic acid-binding Zn ribbon protein|nr:DUF721 domain-containing protein [Planctomycetaceae bacterium]